MGRRGPAPTPTPILKLRNSRALYNRPGEAKPDERKPRCPTWLPNDAKNVWARVTPRLDKMDLLSNTDSEALTRYVVMVAQWRDCIVFLKKHGTSFPITNEAGKLQRVVSFPQVKEARLLNDGLLKLEQHFGLTPSARAHLAQQSNAPPTQDAFDVFLQSKKKGSA